MFVSVLHYMCDGQIAQVYLSLVSLVICLVSLLGGFILRILILSASKPEVLELLQRFKERKSLQQKSKL